MCHSPAASHCLVNTMANSCGDYVGWQKDFSHTCTIWCLAHTRTMRSRMCSHQFVAQLDCCALALVGRFCHLSAAVKRDQRTAACFTSRGARVYSVPSRFRSMMACRPCASVYSHVVGCLCIITVGSGAAWKVRPCAVQHTLTMWATFCRFCSEAAVCGGCGEGAARLGACLIAADIATVLAAFKGGCMYRAVAGGGWVRRVLHATAGAVAHARSRHSRPHQVE